MDAARSAWRGRGQEVHLLYRRTADLMPALASEVEEARREGVQFHFLTLPVRLEGNGRVQRLVAQKTELGEPDASGRCCPVPVAGSEFTLEVDTVIPAVGQTADFSFFGPGLAFDTATILPPGGRPRDALRPRFRGSLPGATWSPDPRARWRPLPPAAGPPWPSTAPSKSSRCRRSYRPWPAAAPTSSWTPPASQLTTRQAMPDLSLTARTAQPNAEVELGFTPEAARAEAARCLTCVCSQCVKNCTFLQHYVQQFPYTEKELVRLLAGARRRRPPDSLFLSLLRALPGGLPQGPPRRPALPVGPGSPGGPGPGTVAAP